MYLFKSRLSRIFIFLNFIFLMFTLAHHSHTAFDGDTMLELNGIVVEIDYRNPHIEIILRVGEDDPNTAEVEGDIWEIDTVSATGANRHELYADTIQSGHPMKIHGWPAKNGDLVMYAGTLFMFEDPEAAIAESQSFGGEVNPVVTQNDDASSSDTIVDAEMSTNTLDFKIKKFIFREVLW